MFTSDWKYLFLIIAIFIAACIETDIYLPAFTDMMSYFSVSEEAVQRLLTWNFVGICISCLFYGPISDAFGRKKPLMLALGLFFIGSILTLFSPNFDLMLIGRVLQGLGSGGCFSLGTAIIFDVYNHQQAIQALSKINTIVPFIMAGAPMLGGYLNNEFGFRSNFLAIALCVLFSLAVSFFWFKETLPTEKRTPFHWKKILKNFARVSSNVTFWQAAGIVSLMFAGYLTFLSGVSILFVMELGVSKQSLPFYQASMLGAWLIASLTSKHAIHQFGIPKVKRIGTILFAFGVLCLALAMYFTPDNPVLLTSGMLFYAVGANWTQGIYFPEAMELFPDIRGVAASLLTSARLFITALVVGLSSRLYDSTAYPIIGVVLAVSAVILCLIYLYEKKNKVVLVNEENPVLEIV